ncbi:unnamed protein product [Ilex paraguariensis]|uniref:Uncharacterized protein n=1 Tax=Ilex paraguariensis TaxID=185542 RepID=A0ABC8TED0_9AQUA
MMRSILEEVDYIPPLIDEKTIGNIENVATQILHSRTKQNRMDGRVVVLLKRVPKGPSETEAALDTASMGVMSVTGQGFEAPSAFVAVMQLAQRGIQRSCCTGYTIGGGRRWITTVDGGSNCRDYVAAEPGHR